MGSLEEFVKNVFKRVLREDYPHLAHPSIVYATVTKAKQLSGSYEYNLNVLDRFGNADATFPEIPGVRSKLQLSIGATVSIGFIYGDIPTIIGEVVI